MVKSIKVIIIAVVLVSMTMILLSSCGQNSPAGTQSANTPKSNIANISKATGSSIFTDPNLTQLISKSGNAEVRLIWEGSSTVSYNIYWSNDPNLNMINGTKITNVTSPYTHSNLANDKYYYYFITKVSSGKEEKLTYMAIAKPSAKISDRVDRIYIPSQAPLTSLPVASSGSGINAFTLPLTLYSPVFVKDDKPLKVVLKWDNLSDIGLLDLDLWVAPPDTRSWISWWWRYTGSSMSYYNNGLVSFSGTGLLGGIGLSLTEVFEVAEPLVGDYAVYIDYWMPYTFVSQSPSNVPMSATLTVYSGGTAIQELGPFTIDLWKGIDLVNITVLPTKQKIKLEIEPKKATIYIHPKNPASGSQQYKATATYPDNTTEDVTNNSKVAWQSSTPAIAGIGQDGLAPPPAQKMEPGITNITAQMLLPPPDDILSNKAELCVECWEVTHIRQNKHVPSTETPDWVDWPFGRIWEEVYVIVNNQIKLDSNGNRIVDYYIDQGPRSKYPGLKPSIGDVGCHMVCANMVITVATQSFSNPKNFNDWLNTLHGFTEGDNGIKWGLINQHYSSYISATGEISLERADQKDKKGNITKKGWTIQDSYSAIDAALDKCNMVILRINGNTGHFQGHYVLIASGRGGNYKIYDPWDKYYSGDSDIQIDNLWNRYQIPGDYEASYNIITLK